MATKRAVRDLESPYVAKENAAPEIYATATGSAVLATVKAVDKTTENEDSAALIPYSDTSAVLIVADGLGGLPAGKAASGQVINSVSDAIAKATKRGSSPRGAILDALETANQAILQAGSGNATTVAAIEIDATDSESTSIRPYHVGDSQILITGQRGRVKLQTLAHSPTGYAVEAGMMDENEALTHDERHYVDNVVGAKDMRIEIGTAFRLARFDTALVGTDGLFDNLYVDEISEHIRSGPLDECAVNLMAAVQARINNPGSNSPSHADDVTFILYRPR